MNASCALQHFCDLHGPQILLVTEAKPYIHEINDTADENLNAIYSQYVKSENLQEKAQCKSCTVSSESVLVSTLDSNNHLLFITSPSTPNQELFKDIRNACVRSLNIEKPAEVNFPILFGDEDNGYCLSLTFSCQDFLARGGQRLYSLCYLSRDKYSLLSLMTLITDCMRQIVAWLQYDAHETHEQERRVKVHTTMNGSTSTYVYRPPPLTPSQRMLCDVVHDPKIIYRVHALFVWLLRTVNSAINESLFDALPTEDQTTQQERKDVSDFDVAEAFLPKRRTTTILAKSVSNPVQPSTMISTTLTNDIHNQSYLESSSYFPAENHQQSFNSFDDDDYDSLQYQFSSYGQEASNLFELFIRKLNNPKYLQYILYNWVIGNRLIIKYTNRIDNKDLIRPLVSVFRLLVPDGCFNLIEAHNQITSCTANMILLDTDVIIDDDVLANLIGGPNENTSTIIRIILDDIEESLRVVKLETPPPTRLDTPIPTYVKSLMDILTDTKLDDQAFETMITQQKMKYLNKAKLYFQLGRCQAASNISSNERQQLSIFNVENTNDLLLIRFWQKGLSQAYRKQIRLLKQDDNQQKSQRTN